ncbi:MAG TPA: hypothetical protein VMT44_06825 [Methanoregula sp.]|nr:hypothetical protein [Methanoregula sp.]
MPEPVTTTPEQPENETAGQPEKTGKHTCACGETHEQVAGTSHRESCTSPLKFGDTCCCGSGQEPKARHPCGHGPRCH